MPKAIPEVQWIMNNALAAIGTHHPKHRKRAIATKVTVHTSNPEWKHKPIGQLWLPLQLTACAAGHSRPDLPSAAPERKRWSVSKSTSKMRAGAAGRCATAGF